MRKKTRDCRTFFRGRFENLSPKPGRCRPASVHLGLGGKAKLEVSWVLLCPWMDLPCQDDAGTTSSSSSGGRAFRELSPECGGPSAPGAEVRRRGTKRCAEAGQTELESLVNSVLTVPVLAGCCKARQHCRLHCACACVLLTCVHASHHWPICNEAQGKPSSELRAS